jgi:hypothetical protein
MVRGNNNEDYADALEQQSTNAPVNENSREERCPWF